VTFKFPTKNNFLKQFFCLLLFEDTFTSFSKKVQKSHKTVETRFFLLFLLAKEGSGSGSIPLTNGSGSGSGRPKNMWIRNTGRKKHMGTQGVHIPNKLCKQQVNMWHMLRAHRCMTADIEMGRQQVHEGAE
jgi:hypothetical protein